MNIKRLAILMLALFMVAGGAALADSRWGTYEGYSKVRVKVNDTVLSSDGVPAFAINGRTVLPLNQIADSFQSIVKWDERNKTVNIYKPNVNMIVAREVSGKEFSTVKTPFGRVDKNSTMTFDVFVQVDNLLTGISGAKLSILDPSGNEVDSVKESVNGAPDNFWYAKRFKINFSESGKYTVRFAFEVDGTMTTVAEKLIVSE